MKAIQCSNCGSNEFYELQGTRICKFCNTRFTIFAEEVAKKEVTIAIGNDVASLLEKCKREPKNAKKYANLILDIDPGNSEALKYL